MFVEFGWICFIIIISVHVQGKRSRQPTYLPHQQAVRPDYIMIAGLILGLHPADDRRRYFVPIDIGPCWNPNTGTYFTNGCSANS